MKTFLVRFTLAALGAIAFASVAATAEVATGTVNGSVTYSGNPVAGAKVVIASQVDSSYGAVTHTDAKGGFSFSGAPLGSVTVKVYDAAGTLAVSGKGELTFDGQVITVALEIAP